MIPVFPEFAPIELTDRDVVEEFFRMHPPLASEYTFTNLFAWRKVNRYQIARFGDGFLIRKEYRGHLSFLQPLAPSDGAEAIRVCCAYLREHGAPPVIERVGEDFIAATPLDHQHYTTHEDRANYDYVYSVQELIDLTGPKFHDKKNLLHQFYGNNDVRYVPLTPDRAEDCLRFSYEWCQERRCEESEGLRQENCAVTQILTHYTDLHVTGGILEAEGEMVGFTVGEALNSDTLVIHIEKAKSNLTGAYQAINREYLAHAGRDFRYVNREQDLGISGLRKAKKSYNPVRMVKKYRVAEVSPVS